MSNKRSKSKYPNLDPKLNLKRRQELIDFDYLDKLSPSEKEWLNKAMGEYMGASFKKDDLGRHSKTNIHKKERVKEVYDANNARNRDIFIKKASTQGLDYFDNNQLDDLREKDLYSDVNFFEDGLIQKLDFEADPASYKLEVQAYIKTLKKTKRQDEEMSERDSYIKFLTDNGFGWTLED